MIKYVKGKTAKSELLDHCLALRGYTVRCLTLGRRIWVRSFGLSIEEQSKDLYNALGEIEKILKELEKAIKERINAENTEPDRKRNKGS